jgi:hypothetical protein
MVKEIKNRIKMEWKVKVCEYLTIRLTCAAAAESFGNLDGKLYM